MKGLEPMSRRIIKDFSRPAQTQNEPPRRRKKKRTWPRVLAILLILTAVALVVWLLASNWQDIVPESLVSWIEDLSAGTTGGSWPVEINGKGVADISQTGSHTVVLTDTASIYLNGSGGESVRRTHAYSRPLLDAAGRYVLVAERGGNRYRLENRSRVLLEKTVENMIYTAAVSEQGDVAAVTDSSQSHLSEISVFTRKGEQRYRWLSSEWLVLDIAFSSDGRRLAAVGCRSADGAMESALMVFDLLSGEEQPVTYSARDVMYSAVHFFPDGMVTAIGDSSLRAVNPGGTLDQTISYEGSELVGFAFAGGTAVVTRPYGSQESGTLTLYSSSGDVKRQEKFEGEFRDVSPYRKGVLLLTDRSVAEIDANGVERTAAVSDDSLMAGCVGDTALVLGLTQLSSVGWE